MCNDLIVDLCKQLLADGSCNVGVGRNDCASFRLTHDGVIVDLNDDAEDESFSVAGNLLAKVEEALPTVRKAVANSR